MAKAKDKAPKQSLKDRLRGKETKIFLAVMALLLVGRAYLWYAEFSFAGDTPAAAQAGSQMNVTVDETKDIYVDVNRMITRWPEQGQPSKVTPSSEGVALLAAHNMFDPKAVLNAPRIEAQADQLAAQAQAALQGAKPDLAAAERAVKEALKINPSCGQAIQVRAKIDEQKKKAEEEAKKAAEAEAPAAAGAPGGEFAAPGPGL